MNDFAAKRYPIYLRTLRQLKKHGVELVQSKDLEALTHIEASTIRRDLLKFGNLGKKGHGYYVNKLIKTLSDELFANEELIIVGLGPIGKALTNYNVWDNVAGKIICGFDDRAITDVKIPVYKISEIPSKKPKSCRIAIICTHKNTQQIINTLIDNGIKAIINFSLEPLTVPDHILVNNVDLGSSIQEMIVRLNDRGENNAN